MTPSKFQCRRNLGVPASPQPARANYLLQYQSSFFACSPTSLTFLHRKQFGRHKVTAAKRMPAQGIARSQPAKDQVKAAASNSVVTTMNMLQDMSTSSPGPASALKLKAARHCVIERAVSTSVPVSDLRNKLMPSTAATRQMSRMAQILKRSPVSLRRLVSISFSSHSPSSNNSISFGGHIDVAREVKFLVRMT